jgi:hypothetical protein
MVLVIIGVSVAVALVNRPREATLLPEGTPEGTVQRYLLAVEEDASRRAYEYLSPALQERCEFQHFRESTRGVVRRDSETAEDFRVTLEGTQAINGRVEVKVRITQFHVSAPFDVSEYSHVQHFTLEKVGETWHFTDPPWPMGWCPEDKQKPSAKRSGAR